MVLTVLLVAAALSLLDRQQDLVSLFREAQ